MPQRVRADAEAGAAALHVGRDKALDAPSCQSPAASIHEQRIRGSSRVGSWAFGVGVCPRRAKREAVHEPRASRLLGGRVERDDALLSALAHDSNHTRPRAEIDILEIEADQLAQTNP